LKNTTFYSSKENIMKKKFIVSIRLMLAISCIAYCSAMNAQLITGKWKLTDAKEMVTDKATGKTHDLGSQIKPILKMMEQVFIFNADGTYFFSKSMGGSEKALEGSGTYAIAVNQLKLN